MIAILFCFLIALLIMLLICLAFPGLFVICEKMITYFCDMISKISGVK